MLLILRCSISFDCLMPAIMRPRGNFVYKHGSVVGDKHFYSKYPDKAKFFNDGLGNAIGCRRNFFRKVCWRKKIFYQILEGMKDHFNWRKTFYLTPLVARYDYSD